MLDNIEIIRQVLASAERAKLPRAGEAMDALQEFNAWVLELNEVKAPRVMSRADKVGRVRDDDGYHNQGGGNFHE